MAKPGDELRHPTTGERLVWRQVARDTDGALLQADMFASPQASPAAAHVHPRQEERFEVLAGVIRVSIDGVETTLGPGDVAVVPPGTPHTWRNVDDVEAQMLVDFRPALRSEMFFETLFGLAADGKTDRKGLPHPSNSRRWPSSSATRSGWLGRRLSSSGPSSRRWRHSVDCGATAAGIRGTALTQSTNDRTPCAARRPRSRRGRGCPRTR